MSTPRPRSPRRSRTARFTLAGLLALPLVELVVAILVGRAIGAAPTVLLLVLLSLSGLVVLRRGGARALRSLAADGSSRPGSAAGPDLRAAGDAAWVLIGGLLLVLPGFVTAAAGLLLVFGQTRLLVGPLLGRGAGLLAGRLVGAPLVGRVAGTRVVQGDVVDATPPGPPPALTDQPHSDRPDLDRPDLDRPDLDRPHHDGPDLDPGPNVR